jgi:DNA topoisomerase IA
MSIGSVVWVAEKPSVAKGIAKILSGGKYRVSTTFSKYNPEMTFPYMFQGKE